MEGKHLEQVVHKLCIISFLHVQKKCLNLASGGNFPIVGRASYMMSLGDTENVYTSNKSASDGDGISEPYLYELEVEHPLHLCGVCRRWKL